MQSQAAGPGAAGRGAVPAWPVAMELLEPRLLLSAVYPNAYEQYLVELINRARANPQAEAARFGIDLNEGLAAGTITAGAKQPVAIDPYLTDGAVDHCYWMIATDTFSHTGAGGSSPGDRMAAAGYTFAGSWGWGENIAWQGYTGTDPDPFDSTVALHQTLFVDTDQPGRGHRTNLLAGEWRQIGAGVVEGAFTGYNAVMVTEDFAVSGSSLYLTGVAFDESVQADGFYTPGEGMGGVQIRARRQSDGATYTTTTWASGGYSLALPRGTYDVTASGGDMGGSLSFYDVVIDDRNVKLDVIQPHTLDLYGTAGRDTFVCQIRGSTWTVTLNGVTNTYGLSQYRGIAFYGRGGEDTASLTGKATRDVAALQPGTGTVTGNGYSMSVTSVENVKVYGGDGDTAKLYDSSGDDTFLGKAGYGRLIGSGFNNYVKGYDEVRAYASGGEDRARLYDSGGADLFYSKPGFSWLRGTGCFNYASGFARVYAYASGGNDTAKFYDSPGKDEFRATPAYARMTGRGFYNYARSFERVYAYASAGNDTARLYDSPGKDAFRGTATYGRLQGRGFWNRAAYFDTVRAYARAGGNDTAELYDSAGNDTFRAAATVSRLEGPGYRTFVSYFDRVNAHAGSGGANDRALFVAPAGTYTYQHDADSAYMTGAGFHNFAERFDRYVEIT